MRFGSKLTGGLPSVHLDQVFYQSAIGFDLSTCTLHINSGGSLNHQQSVSVLSSSYILSFLGIFAITGITFFASFFAAMKPCTATVIRVDFKFACHHCLRQSMIRGKNLLDTPSFSPSNFGDGGNLISSLLQHGGVHSCSGWLPEPLHRWSCNCGHRACTTCVFSLRYCAVELATGSRTVPRWQGVLAVAATGEGC